MRERIDEALDCVYFYSKDKNESRYNELFSNDNVETICEIILKKALSDDDILLLISIVNAHIAVKKKMINK